MGIFPSKSEQSQRLFPYTLIPAFSKLPPLPASLTIRPLCRTDFQHGHASLLPFADVHPITQDQWTERFDFMSSCQGTYYVVVIEEEDGKKIVGTATLFVERKFLFNLGSQGHIEDVAISSDCQGKGLGKALIEVLSGIAEQVGCYKTILDCREAKEGFYLKCGFERRGLEMHRYHSKEAEKCSV